MTEMREYEQVIDSPSSSGPVKETLERVREEEEERTEDGMEVEVKVDGRRKEQDVNVRGDESL